MADYKINAQINFKLNAANAKPIMDSLEKQFRSRPLNLPVNFRFRGVNTQEINKYNAAFRSLSHTISQLSNSSLKSANSLAALAGQLKHVGASLGSFGQSSNNLRNFQTNTNNLAKSVASTGKNASSSGKQFIGFAESIGISTRRLASFGVATSVLATTSLAIRRATIDALEFDRELVRLKQVGGDSDKAIGGIEKTISKLGTNLGVSSKDMSESAVTLRQAGLSAGDTSKALEVLGKTTLSPTFENLKSTTEGLIAVFNQFDNNIGNMEKHFDAITRASANYAVESTDIVEAIKRTGGAFKSAGGTIEELIAMFTTIRSTTRESAESIATGMRTIVARLEDPTIAQKLHGIGVELYDMGKFVGPAEAINRIGEAIRKLPAGDIRAFSIIKDIGGLRQPSRVIPLLYNSDTTKKVMQDIAGSQGALAKDAETAQQALIVQLAKVKEGFLDLFRVIATDSSVRNTLDLVIKGVQSLTEAMRQLKPLVPVFLAFTTAKAIGFGISNISNFRRGATAPAKGYAEGGHVTGGIPGKDSVPVMLMPDEYVFSKKAVDRIGKENLDNIHKMAKGGRVYSPIIKELLSDRGKVYNRAVRANFIKMLRSEHAPRVEQHYLNRKLEYINSGNNAVVYKTSDDTALRFGNLGKKVEPERPKDNLTLQPILKRKLNKATIEELPFVQSVYEQTGKNEIKSYKLEQRFKKKVLAARKIPTDINGWNIGIHEGKLIAIDPHTYKNPPEPEGFVNGGKINIVKGYRGIGRNEIRELAKIHRTKGRYTSPYYGEIFFSIDEKGGYHGDLRKEAHPNNLRTTAKEYAMKYSNAVDASGFLLNMEVPAVNTLGSKYFGEDSVPRMNSRYVKNITRVTLNDQGKYKLGKTFDAEKFLSRYNRMFHPKGYATGGVITSPTGKLIKRLRHSGKHIAIEESALTEGKIVPQGAIGQKTRLRRVEVDPHSGEFTPRARWYAKHRQKRFLKKLAMPVGYAKGGSIYDKTPVFAQDNNHPSGSDPNMHFFAKGGLIPKYYARGGRIDILQDTLDKAAIPLDARKFVRGVHFTNSKRGTPAALGWFQRGTGLIGVHYKDDHPTLLHEFGHAIDFNIGSHIEHPKYGSELSHTYNKEIAEILQTNLPKGYLQNEYFTGSNRESFAEAFKLYSLNKLGEKSPNASNSIHKEILSNHGLTTDLSRIFDKSIIPLLRRNPATQFKKLNDTQARTYAQIFKLQKDPFEGIFAASSKFAKGYAGGGTIGASLSFLRKLFKPKGTDTVPIMATPGEFVIKKSSAEKIGYNTLKLLNENPSIAKQIEMRSRRMNRLRSKYFSPPDYGEGEYATFGDYLLSHQLEHRKKMHKVMGNPFLRKPANFASQKVIRHKQFLRKLITEEKLKDFGIFLDDKKDYSLDQVSTMLRDAKKSDEISDSQLFGTMPGLSTGGELTPTIQYRSKGGIIYRADGGDIPFAQGQRKIKKVPDPNQYTKREHGVLKYAKTTERGDIPFTQPLVPVGTGDYQVLPVGGVQKNVVPPFKPEDFQPKPAYIPPANPNEDPAFIAEQKRLAEQYHQRVARESITFNSPLKYQGMSARLIEYRRRKQLSAASNVATSTSPISDQRLENIAAQEMIERMKKRNYKESQNRALQNFEEKQKSLTSPYPLSVPQKTKNDLPYLHPGAPKIANAVGLFGSGAEKFIQPTTTGKINDNTFTYPIAEPTNFPTGPVSPGILPHLNVLNKHPEGYTSPKEYRDNIVSQRLINRSSARTYRINQNRQRRMRQEEGESHFGSGMFQEGLAGLQHSQNPHRVFGVKDTSPKNLYQYTAMSAEGKDIGIKSIKTISAKSIDAAKTVLQQQGQFVTSIQQIDNTFSNKVFPNFSKWLGSMKKGLDKTSKQAENIDPAIKEQMKASRFGKVQAGLFAASIAVPMLTEHFIGDNKPQEGGNRLKGGIAGLTTGAVGGAAVGSTFGPWGTAIGALLGGLAGITSSLSNFNDQLKEIDLKKFNEDLQNIEIKNQQLSTSGRSTVGNLLSRGIRAGLTEQKHTLWERTKTVFGMGTNHRVGKYEALNTVPEEQRNALSDTIRTLFEVESKKNPNQSYKQIIDKLGNFKVGNVEYGAGEVLGLNKKNTEDMQKLSVANRKAYDLQEKMNALLGQLNKDLGLTAAQLEAFSTSLQTSGEQYEARSQYASMGSGALNGQITAAPNNVGLNNLGGPNTVAGQLHAFSATGGGYDKARQALLQIVQEAGNEKLGNMDEQEAAMNAGAKASASFRALEKQGVGGAYNEQIAGMTQHVIGSTTKLQETIRDRGADKVVDQILEPFKNIKETGKEATKNFQAVYAKQQQAQVDKYDRNFELRQQRVALTKAENTAVSEQYIREKELRPDETSVSYGASRYIGGPNRASTIQRNRIISQPEIIANSQFTLQKQNLQSQQEQFSVGGLTADKIAEKYRSEANKLEGQKVEYKQAERSGKSADELSKLNDEMLKTQDNMRNYAAAIKNLAENTGVLEAAQAKYRNAVDQFTADYESRKNDANTLAFGSRGEKKQLMMKENITRQALSLNQEQFSNLPDQIKKIVFERLQETQGMTRTVEQYDKYGRFRGTQDVNGEQAIQYFRQPYQNMLQGGASRRLRKNAEQAGKLVNTATDNRLDAQRELIGLGQQNANKQTVQGEDNFQKYLAGINQSIKDQMAATDRFLAGSAELTKALNSFQGKLQIERNGRVEVIINGIQALQAIKGDLQKEIMDTIVEKIKEESAKQAKNQPLR